MGQGRKALVAFGSARRPLRRGAAFGRADLPSLEGEQGVTRDSAEANHRAACDTRSHVCRQPAAETRTVQSGVGTRIAIDRGRARTRGLRRAARTTVGVRQPGVAAVAARIDSTLDAAL